MIIKITEVSTCFCCCCQSVDPQNDEAFRETLSRLKLLLMMMMLLRRMTFEVIY